MRRKLLGISLVIGMMVVAACGGSSGTVNPVGPADVTSSTADGATGVSNTNFSETITWPAGNAVNAATVTATSFYIVPATAAAAAQVVKGDWNAGNCNVDDALVNIELDTAVDGGTSSSTLSILDDLDVGTTYYICLTSAITFSNGASFAGMTNSFTTSGEAGFSLTSTDISNGGTVPQVNAETGCGGSNLSPQLTWANPPDGTLGYAITVTDEDAPTFIHWILYNIPSTVTSLAQGAATPAGATTVTNGFGTAGYGGPCPPVGETHTYAFTVYALDVADATTISGFDDSGNSAFVNSISGNTLGTSTFRGTYTGL